MGYKLYIELESFSFNAKGRGQNVFQTYPRYEILHPKNKKQEAKWIKNHVKAYYGSFTQFLKSLYNNTLKENHFRVEHSERLTKLNKDETKQELLRQGVRSPSLQKSLKVYKLKRRIKINYRHFIDYQLGQKKYSVLVQKRTYISPNDKRKIFIVYKNGKILDTNSIVASGEWGINRVYNSMPGNYSLENDLKKLTKK